MGRVRERVGDKRVLALVKAFLRAGILTEQAGFEDTVTGTPQGGILSPLLANIALSTLDEHYARAWTAMGSEWKRRKRRARGEATFRLVRYADDFVVVLAGQRKHAEALVAETAAVLAPARYHALPGEDPHRAHRRGNRVPRLAHPAPPGLERPQLRLHLRLQAVACGGQGEGQGDHSLRTQPDARPAAAPAQPGAQGLVHLLPRRGLRSHLQLPARLRLAAGYLLAAPQAPQSGLALAETALPPEVVADRRRDGAL